MRMPIAIRNQGHRDPAVFRRIVLQFSDLFDLAGSWLKVSGRAGTVEHSTNFAGSDLVKTLAYTLTFSLKKGISFCATLSSMRPSLANRPQAHPRIRSSHLILACNAAHPNEFKTRSWVEYVHVYVHAWLQLLTSKV